MTVFERVCVTFLPTCIDWHVLNSSPVRFKMDLHMDVWFLVSHLHSVTLHAVKAVDNTAACITYNLVDNLANGQSRKQRVKTLFYIVSWVS